MRKKNIVFYAFIIVVLTMVITPIVTAKPYNLLNGDVFIVLQSSDPWSWIGNVTGDIEGDLYVYLVDYWFPAPGVEHFIEEWLIVTETGTIEGENKGKWTMANFKWIANGEVTGATEEWTH